MKIAIDVRSIMYGNYTGVGEYTYQLLDHLFKIDRDNEYILFCNSSKPITLPEWDYPNVKKVVFKYPNKLLHLSMVFFKRPRIQKMIEKKIGEKIDLIFLPNQNFFIPVAGAKGEVKTGDNAGEKAGAKFVITMHDLAFEHFPQFFTRFDRLWHRLVNLKRLVKQADQVISVSKHTKHDLQELWGTDEQKISVVSPGLDPIFFQTLNNEQKKSIKEKYQLPENYLLYLGTLEPRKNIELIIAGFEAIAQQYPDLHLVLAGGWGWETKEIEKALAKAKHKERIKLLGYVDRQDKPALYNLAQIFLFPSFYEGFGFPPLEALSQGCPVITSFSSALSEIEGDHIHFVSPHDLGMFVNILEEILENDQLTDRLAFESKTITERYQWPEKAQQTLDILKKLFN